MWSHEPGSFTRIMAAMVTPRKTSSETMRPGRAGSTAACAFETGAAIVSAVAMRRSSADGDSTAANKMPQRRYVWATVCPRFEGTLRPFRAGHPLHTQYRGRCPGLMTFAPLARPTWRINCESSMVCA